MRRECAFARAFLSLLRIFVRLLLRPSSCRRATSAAQASSGVRLCTSTSSGSLSLPRRWAKKNDS